MKTATVGIEDRAFALFFRPHRVAFGSSNFPAPENLPSKTKKVLMPREWAQLELTDALIRFIMKKGSLSSLGLIDKSQKAANKKLMRWLYRCCKWMHHVLVSSFPFFLDKLNEANSKHF